MSPLLPTDPPPRSAVSAFGAGFRAAWLSVLAYVVIGTYVGIGALTTERCVGSVGGSGDMGWLAQLSHGMDAGAIAL